MAWGAIVIPGPTPSGYAWRANPIQRARPAQTTQRFAPQQRKPFSMPEAEGLAPASKTAEVHSFPGAAWATPASQAPRLADHCFIRKSGRTMSDSAVRLLRLKDWLEVCISEPQFESQAFTTECRLREQAAFIIGHDA